jgi:hypothetical protein
VFGIDLLAVLRVPEVPREHSILFRELTMIFELIFGVKISIWMPPIKHFSRVRWSTINTY